MPMPVLLPILLLSEPPLIHLDFLQANNKPPEAGTLGKRLSFYRLP